MPTEVGIHVFVDRSNEKTWMAGPRPSLGACFADQDDEVAFDRSLFGKATGLDEPALDGAASACLP
jgi:hypothetical protein